MTSSLVSLASVVDVPELHERPEFMPTWAYGLFAFCLFIALYCLLLAFRNTAKRYGTPKSELQRHGDKH